MTCFVDNEDAWPDDTVGAIGQAIAAYSEAGVRAMVARMMFDEQPDHLQDIIRSLQQKDPQVVHVDNWRPTDRLLSDLDRLIRTYNGTAGGRIQVWPSPVGTLICSDDMFETSRRLARDNGTMWTIHLVQGPAGVENPGPSITENLLARGHLDRRLLAGHSVAGLGFGSVGYVGCNPPVAIDEADAASGTASLLRLARSERSLSGVSSRLAAEMETRRGWC